MRQADPAQARRVNQILWPTLLAAPLAYVAVILGGIGTSERPPDLPALPIALAGVALATGIGAQLSWRRATGAGQLAHATPPDPAKAFTFYILAWVLDETIAIFGLILGLLAFSTGVWGLFSLAAFVLMFSHRPS